jgi:hypothetical protein
VLDRQHVDLIDVEKIRRTAIRAQVALGDFEPDAGGIRVAASGVVHRDDKPIGIGQLFDQRIRQMRGECGDAALARQVIPERRESPDLVRFPHAVSRRTVQIAGAGNVRSSSAIRFKAVRLSPWASRAMSHSPSRLRPGTRRSSAATSSSRSCRTVSCDLFFMMCSQRCVRKKGRA